MNNELNINELVKIESLGVIKQQLDKVELFVDDKVKDIPNVLKELSKLSDEEKEEKKQDVKKYKQYLSKIKTELETRRKEIKEEINKPYAEFNDYYSNGVLVKLNNGIEQLNDTINSIEDSQRKQKEKELILFFAEWQRNYHLDFVSFDDMKLNITITASLKSLKDEIKEKLEKINNDIEIINNEDNKDELLLEYRNNGYDYQKAKLTLIERKKQLEEIKQQQEEKTNIEQQEQKQEEKVEEIIAPKEIIEDDEILEVSFTVKASKDKIIKLKDFMKELEIEYE